MAVVLIDLQKSECSLISLAFCVISLLYFQVIPVVRHTNEEEQTLTFIRLGVAGRSATEGNG